VAFTAALEGVGASLGQAQTKYEEAYKRLCQGNNNLIRVGENMRKLGLPTTKRHSARILELSQEDNDQATPDDTPQLAAENE
jgi:DNA recombination protein RmuC